MHVSLPSPVRHVTLIDDDETVHFLFRALTKRCMPELGISVYSNAREVLKMLLSNSFQTSAIVLDLNMPGMNGFEFLEELERSGKFVPVYVASSSDDPSDISAVSAFRNVVKYIVKPFTTDHIRMIAQARN